MKSNYNKVGDFIRLVKDKNREGLYSELLGINIDKFFMPSVANIHGVDLSTYKVVRKDQFACNRMHVGRDYRIPISLSRRDEPFLVSPAYDVFEIKDTSILLPEYLMMWFSRKEFDRNAWFYTDADVRGGLPWSSFCEIKLPIPSIEKQLEIVREYNTIVNRITLNEQLIQKLEETAQTIYKRWFVEFEFPDKNGNSYKSSGGKMVWCEELEKEIPEGWELKPFTSIVKLSGGGTPDTNNPEYWNGDIPFFTPADVVDSYYSIKTYKNVTKKGLENSSTKLYPKNTVFVTARGTVGAISISGFEMTMNQSCYAISGKNGMNQYFVHQTTLSAINKLKSEVLGAVFAALVTKDFESQLLIEPDKYSIHFFGEKVESFYENILNIVCQNKKLSEMKGLILSKMTKVEAITDKSLV